MPRRKKDEPRSRSHGEGTVFRLTNGKWKGEVRIAGKVRSVTRGTAAEADAALDELRAKYEATPDVIDQTTGEFLTKFLDERLPRRAKVKSTNTTASYRWAIETHLVPGVGAIPLRDLRARHIEENVLDRMAAAGLSKSTVTRVRAVAITALDHAVKHSDETGVLVNVARLTDLPPLAEPDEGAVLTLAEVRRLLTAAEKPADPKHPEAGPVDRLAALWRLMATHGLRPGEASAISWDDIDEKAGTLTVRHSLKREGSKTLRLGSPKTVRSARPIALHGDVLAALKAHKGRQRVEQLAAPAWRSPLDENGEEVPLVFCTESGRLIDPSNLRRAFSDALERAKIKRHATPNALRRTHATIGVEETDATPDQLRDGMGHAPDSRVMERHYSKPKAPTTTGVLVGDAIAAR